VIAHPTDLSLVPPGDVLGLMAALFLAGLAGGLTHCAAMCGPFVVAQTLARGKGFAIERLGGFLLLPYHFGRATTYVALGAVLGSVGGSIASLPGLKPFLAALLGLGALIFALQAVGRLPHVPGRLGVQLSGLVRRLIETPTGFRGYALGIALGFLPCGLLYGALASAAGSGGASGGALAMLGFVLGTMPALAIVQFAGSMAAKRWKAAVGRLAPFALAFNAAALLAIAWRTVN
jgi:hypothetical protein